MKRRGDLVERFSRFQVVPCALAGVLWWAAYSLFSLQPFDPHFRIDRGEAVAYPMSDALSHYLNGLALFSGDGWVNWREDTRWSVDKPGWGATLGLLNWFCGGDVEKVQHTLTLIFAILGPALFFLLLSLYRGPRRTWVAFGMSLAFLAFGPLEQWGFTRTMMTEAPTLLLSLLFCGFVVRFGSLPRWRARVWFGIGAAGGSLCMIREQSRYGVALVFLLLAWASLKRFRYRWKGLLAGVCGVVFVLGPFFLKTSYHLGHLYTGTSYTSLRAMLDDSPAGRAVGGADRESRQTESEGVAISRMKEIAWAAIRKNLASPLALLSQAASQTHRFLFGSWSRGIGSSAARVGLGLVTWVLVLVGIGHGLQQRGLVALAPWCFLVGYLSPLFAFSHYLDRFGNPVCFVGWAFLAGGILSLFQAKRISGCLPFLTHGACHPIASIRAFLGPKRRGPRARKGVGICFPSILAFGVGMAIWLGGCTGLLLWNDFRPLGQVGVAELVANPRVAELARVAGWASKEELRTTVERAYREEAGYSKVGIAFLPFSIQPGEEPFAYPWNPRGLAPREEPYTAVYVYIPWKRRGSLGRSQRFIEGPLYAGFRQGDEVVVLPRKENPGGFYAGAIFPTRWGASSPLSP